MCKQPELGRQQNQYLNILLKNDKMTKKELEYELEDNR